VLPPTPYDDAKGLLISRLRGRNPVLFIDPIALSPLRDAVRKAATGSDSSAPASARRRDANRRAYGSRANGRRRRARARQRGTREIGSSTAVAAAVGTPGWSAGSGRDRALPRRGTSRRFTRRVRRGSPAVRRARGVRSVARRASRANTRLSDTRCRRRRHSMRVFSPKARLLPRSAGSPRLVAAGFSRPAGPPEGGDTPTGRRPTLLRASREIPAVWVSA